MESIKIIGKGVLLAVLSLSLLFTIQNSCDKGDSSSSILSLTIIGVIHPDSKVIIEQEEPLEIDSACNVNGICEEEEKNLSGYCPDCCIDNGICEKEEKDLFGICPDCLRPSFNSVCEVAACETIYLDCNKGQGEPYCALVCDNYTECPGGEDEISCASVCLNNKWACNPDSDPEEIVCANSCDGRAECYDKSDEKWCGCEMHCHDGIDNDSDGKTDCDDDECSFDKECFPPTALARLILTVSGGREIFNKEVNFEGQFEKFLAGEFELTLLEKEQIDFGEEKTVLAQIQVKETGTEYFTYSGLKYIQVGQASSGTQSLSKLQTETSSEGEKRVVITVSSLAEELLSGGFLEITCDRAVLDPAVERIYPIICGEVPELLDTCDDGVKQTEEECDWSVEIDENNECGFLEHCDMRRLSCTCRQSICVEFLDLIFVQRQDDPEAWERGMNALLLLFGCPYCGDGIISTEKGETCDWGKKEDVCAAEGKECNIFCQCQEPEVLCGNGKWDEDEGEFCDGSADGYNGCKSGGICDEYCAACATELLPPI